MISPPMPARPRHGINVKGDRRHRAPLEWIEPLDWKAYAIVFRLHTLDHLNQVRKPRRGANARLTRPPA
jgi:hypothetical protein